MEPEDEQLVNLLAIIIPEPREGSTWNSCRQSIKHKIASVLKKRGLDPKIINC
jgi:hypothetical protein